MDFPNTGLKISTQVASVLTNGLCLKKENAFNFKLDLHFLKRWIRPQLQLQTWIKSYQLKSIVNLFVNLFVVLKKLAPF